MTLTLSAALKESLLLWAQRRRISVEELVLEALRWYLQTGAETVDELVAWQEVRDEASRLIEETPARRRRTDP